MKKVLAFLVAFLVLTSVSHAQRARVSQPAGSATVMSGNSGVCGFAHSLNFNTTADQPIYIKAPCIVRRIVVTNSSRSFTTAAGGIYTATSKGGTAIVAAAQTYAGLTAGGKYIDLTLAAVLGTDLLEVTPVYLSLTTAQGAAAIADVYIFGDILE